MPGATEHCWSTSMRLNKVSFQTVVFLTKYLEDSSLQKQQILRFKLKSGIF